VHRRQVEFFLNIFALCYSHFIVTMALSCIISEIKRDIGRKSRFFHAAPAFEAAPIRGSPFSECCRNFWYGKTRMVWLPDGEKSLRIWLLVSFPHNTRTWRTDGQTPRDGMGHTRSLAIGCSRTAKSTTVKKARIYIMIIVVVYVEPLPYWTRPLSY